MDETASRRIDYLLVASVVLNICCVGNIGYSVTFPINRIISAQKVFQSYEMQVLVSITVWIVAGVSTHLFLFVVSCIATMVGMIALSHTEEMKMSRFFKHFNGVLLVFLISGTVASVIVSSAVFIRRTKECEIKRIDIPICEGPTSIENGYAIGAVMGILACVVHCAIFSLLKPTDAKSSINLDLELQGL